MNFRTTYILMGLVAALLIGFALYLLVADEKPTGEGYLLPTFNAAGFKSSDITSLEIQKPDETLVFVREGKERWRLEKPVQARVDSSAVENLVRDLLSAKHSEKGVDIRSLAQHHLDNPSVKVTLNKGADYHSTVSVGDVTAGGAQAVVYVLSSDAKDQKPWAVRKSNLSGLFKFPDPPDAANTAALVRGLNDFRSTKLLGQEIRDAINQSQAIRLRQGKQEVAMSRRPDGAWRFDQPPEWGLVESEGGFGPSPDGRVTNLRRLLENVYNIQVMSPQDFIDNPQELAKYGLNTDNPDVLRIEVQRRAMSGEDPTGTDVLLVGKQVEAAGDKFYVKLESENVVAQVPAVNIRSIKGVMEEPKVLRSHDLVRINKDRVDAIDIESEATKNKVELRQTGEPPAWKVYDAAAAGQNANRLAVEELLAALTAPKQVIDFPPAGAADNVLGFDKPAGEIRLWIGGIVKEEKGPDPKKDENKDAKGKPDEKKGEKKEEKQEAKAPEKPKLADDPAVRLLFGKESGEGVYVRRISGGEKTDLIAPKTLLNQVRKTRLDFLDVSLKPFQPDQVVKVQFTKGKELYDIQKEGTGPATMASWKFFSPEARKGRLADPAKLHQLLQPLSTLRPMRVVAEKATPEQLGSWGLDPKAPLQKVTLTLAAGSEPKERVFLFGSDASKERGTVYAKVADQDVVFEAPRLVRDTINSTDFVDTTVYRLDRSKVKGLKLRGWQDVVGSVVAREFVFQNGQWSFKGEAPYAIDAGKIDIFLDDILAPRADAFVPGGAKPEHGLDVNKGALEITIEVDGGQPVTLLLGAADSAGKLVYAQTNQLPGEVFTLLRDRFKSVREKPAVFRKE
jgi:hypothetical protein